MNKEDFPLYKLDLTGISPFNKITLEYGKRDSQTNGDLFIPLKAPFYINSVQLYHPNGAPMVLDEDYEFYGILSKLSAYTAKPVGLYIRFKKPEIQEWKVTYQTVGNFNKITTEILNMLKVLTTDDRMVDWENIDNKPLWFVPEVHQHDWSFEIFMFTELASELLRLVGIQETTSNNVLVRLEKFQARIEVYIEEYQKGLFKLIEDHDAGRVNNHGVSKAVLGLENVDNFATATLQETLDGLRNDLHLTVQNATKAVEAASGRNERLFPSGSLPLLRYGSDSFIPPKIDGSFEGMGGIFGRIGAVLESSGELLVLQSRYNGQTRGLYYIRAMRFGTTRPEWEFTSYRYEHPTAKADGATLSVIINGSNQYGMVVGDNVNNIWYWCETNGTLNPARHILKRIDTATATLLTQFHARTNLLVDQDYKNKMVLMMGVDIAYVKTVRPTWPDTAATGGGDRKLEGYLFFANLKLSGTWTNCKVNYTHPSFGNYNDKLFTPYIRKMGTAGGLTGVIEFHAKYSKALSSIWEYDTVYAFSGQGSDGKAVLRLETRIYGQTAAGNSNIACSNVWKGKFEIVESPTMTINITPVENEKLYKVNPESPFDTSNGNEGDLYKQWKVSPFAFVISWGTYAGSILLPGGHRLTLVSTMSYSIPFKANFTTSVNFSSPDKLIEIEDYVTPIVKSSDMILEYTPIGLAGSFINPFMLVANIDDTTTAGVMVRQVASDGNTEWIHRNQPFMDATYGMRNDNVTTMTIDGRPVKSHPIVSKTNKVNLGQHIVLTQTGLPNESSTAIKRKRWVEFLGADAFSSIDGKAAGVGDGLLVKTCKPTIINDVINLVPQIVYNVKKPIMTTIKAWLQTKGFPVDRLDKSWTIHRGTMPDGTTFEYLIVTGTRPGSNGYRNAYFCPILVRFAGTGTPTTVNGYQYYDDVSVTILSTFVEKLYLDNVIGDSFGNPGGIQAQSAIGFNGWNKSINGTLQPTEICGMLRSLHRYPVPGYNYTVDVLIEIDTAYNIKRVAGLIQDGYNPESRTIGNAFYGIGSVTTTKDMMQGAGVIVADYDMSGASATLYDAILTDRLSNTRSLVISNLLGTSYIVYFKEIKNVILGGKTYDIPAGYKDIRATDTNPANKIFYVYLRFRGGVPVYDITSAMSAESPVNSLIAKITCGATQIDTIVPYNRFSMDSAIISDQRQGSAILSTGGSIYQVGDTSTILNPATDYVSE
ncbi:hypothetical protein CF8_0132 [Aeromonas phage CF8]|nr:hypothetical protein CF8_0132 [Aeromonas phage CF8]